MATYFNAAHGFVADSDMTDDATKEYIRKLLQNLVEWTSEFSPLVWINSKSRRAIIEPNELMMESIHGNS